MTISENATGTFRCPRCGGAMYKPAGSSLYWHATNDHPPCSITNIAGIAQPHGQGSQGNVLPNSQRQQGEFDV